MDRLLARMSGRRKAFDQKEVCNRDSGPIGTMSIRIDFMKEEVDNTDST